MHELCAYTASLHMERSEHLVCKLDMHTDEHLTVSPPVPGLKAVEVHYLLGSFP